MRVKFGALEIVGLGGLDDFVMIGVASDCLLAFGVDTAGDLDKVAEGGFGGNGDPAFEAEFRDDEIERSRLVEKST